MLIETIKSNLHLFAAPEKAEISKHFFKTGVGQYGEGDIFIGITAPQIKSIAKQFYKEVGFEEIQSLLHSKIHEERALALVMLVVKFQKTKDVEVVDFYLKSENLQYINNWDLVDVSCYKILGEYLLMNPDKVNLLYDFSKSENLWIRRIAIVSTLAFIRKNQFEHTIKISETLLNDKHDLIHKAVGWMLREMGKKNEDVLLEFLNKHHFNMPRVMLRYSVERLGEENKKAYMKLSKK